MGGGQGGAAGRSGRRLGCGPTGLTPRLLLSIDRSGDLAEAQDTVALALEFAAESPLVVGIDFSGNPTKHKFLDFLPAVMHARSHGLRVCVHAAEIDNASETNEILK